MTRLWDKGTPLDARVLGFTAGDDYLLDNRLVRYDIQASIAHAEMLAVQGLLSGPDLQSIREALTAIGAEHALGHWRISLEQEDGQTAIENMLTARIGATGGRLHAGRSRNDQVLAALRLYMRDAAEELRRGAAAVADALDALAARHPDMAIPGYTHMQQAMPSTVALWAQGFAAEIRDDAEGLQHAQTSDRQKSLGIRCGLWHAQPRCQPRSDAQTFELYGDARARDRGSTVTRQSRSATVLRDHTCSRRIWDGSQPT
jgi:argininosuccinate lyase